ncbi:MAG: alginate lyase family protein, partial [Polaromonas sp.]|nr:alginate lyase family protein [Gemmatimonadaceae bacterium]
WREQGWQILREQAVVQIRPDGVYFEQSAWYQSYTLDFYVLGITWARLSGLHVPADLIDDVRRAAIALRTVTRPDGTIARLGDDDGGRTLPLTSAAFGDMTDSLWRAALLLSDTALIPPSTEGRDALLWLEGPAGSDVITAQKADPASRQSRALRNGGWLTQVEQAAAPERDHWLVFDAGPHGALSHAHSHADALGVDLSVHGVPILIDAGTGAYVGPTRRIYRSTARHNTVTVDGYDSSEQGTSFNWRRATDSSIVGFGCAAGVDFVSASHDGYCRLVDPVRHHRTILRFHRHYWLMFDTLEAAAPHDVLLTLQAGHDVHVEQRSAQLFVLTSTRAGADSALSIAVDPRLDAHVEERMVSPAYALQLPASAVECRATLAGVTLCTAMGATDEGAPRLVEQQGVEQIWRIGHRGGADLVACPAGDPLTLGPASFDGRALALLGAESPHTIVAAGAGTLHLEGRAYLLAADDVRLARCAPDGTWTMEP